MIGCPDAGTCVQGQARSFDLPQFIAVDFANKQVRTTKESGENVVSLDKLAAGGYITPEEYKKKKKQILAGM